MISKLAASIILGVVTLTFAVPTTSFAKSSNPAKTKKLEKELNALKKGAPFAKVNNLVTQLVKLDPTKAVTYTNKGLSKGLTKAQANTLGNNVIKIVNASKLPSSKKKSLVSSVKKAVKKYVPPKPTPTPYRASVFALPAVV